MDSTITLRQHSAPKGDCLEPPPSSHPILTPSYELRPSFIAMVREQTFSGTNAESPYAHLREFEQLCSCLTIVGMTQETLKWKLFSFSLAGGAKKWYSLAISTTEGSWETLREKF